MSHLQEVEWLARQVRRAVKRWARTNQQVCSRDLCGACAIGSFALWQVLLARGFDAHLVLRESLSEGHCWVEVGPHVVDITATQFNGPLVAIFPKKQPPTWFTRNIAFLGRRNKRDLRALEVLGAWEAQSPFGYEKHVGRLISKLT